MVKEYFVYPIGLLFFSIALLSKPAFAEKIECPQPISINESLGKTISDQWSSVQVDTSDRYLAGVTFFDGDPKENKSIAPIRDVSSSKQDRIATWQFGASSEPVWLSCRYIDTGVSLFRQLTKYKECRVSYGVGGIIKEINCK